MLGDQYKVRKVKTIFHMSKCKVFSFFIVSIESQWKTCDDNETLSDMNLQGQEFGVGAFMEIPLFRS